MLIDKRQTKRTDQETKNMLQKKESYRQMGGRGRDKEEGERERERERKKE